MRYAERKGGGKAAGYPRPPPCGDIDTQLICSHVGNVLLRSPRGLTMKLIDGATSPRKAQLLIR